MPARPSLVKEIGPGAMRFKALDAGDAAAGTSTVVRPTSRPPSFKALDAGDAARGDWIMCWIGKPRKCFKALDAGDAAAGLSSTRGNVPPLRVSKPLMRAMPRTALVATCVSAGVIARFKALDAGDAARGVQSPPHQRHQERRFKALDAGDAAPGVGTCFAVRDLYTRFKALDAGDAAPAWPELVDSNLAASFQSP